MRAWNHVLALGALAMLTACSGVGTANGVPPVATSRNASATRGTAVAQSNAPTVAAATLSGQMGGRIPNVGDPSKVGALLRPRHYTIADLGTAPNAPYSYGAAVNKAGIVAGWALDPQTSEIALRYANGAVTVLPGEVNGMYNRALGINDAGDIVGRSANAATGYHALLWKHNGSVVELDAPGWNDGIAFAINRSGQVAGDAYRVGTHQFRHAVLFANGTVTSLDDQDSDSEAFTINDRGTAAGRAGSHAATFDHGAVHDLGTLGGATSAAFGINVWGAVVGNADVSGNQHAHAFVWALGKMYDLGVLPQRTDSFATAINDLGEIVGWSSGYQDAAFVWSAGTMSDLNTLIPAGSGWSSLVQATAINDGGQITGVGYDQAGERAFLLTPTK